MNKVLKISLIIGGTLIASTGGYLIYRSIKKKNEEEDDKKHKEDVEKQALEQSIKFLTTTSSGVTTSPSKSGMCKSKFITPTRNMEMDVNNPLEEIMGVKLYPAQKDSDTQGTIGHPYAKGFTTLRNSAEVNTKQGIFDYSNQIGTVNSGSVIGTVIGEKYDNQNPSHRWFKVKLPNKRKDCSGITGGIYGCEYVTTAWVRADTVTFKKLNRTPYACQLERICKGGTDKTDSSISSHVYNLYKNMSSSEKQQVCKKVGVTTSNANGSMIEKYSKNLLGANVFPHSNWMNPIYATKDTYNNSFECGDMLNDL